MKIKLPKYPKTWTVTQTGAATSHKDKTTTGLDLVIAHALQVRTTPRISGAQASAAFALLGGGAVN